MTIRVVQVGYGSVGTRRAELVDADPRAMIVAVADPDPAARQRARERFGDTARIDTTLAALLGATSPDAVVISSPNAAHAPDALAALAAGADVLVEKPLSPTASTTSAVVAAAAEAGRVLKLGANHMYFPAVLEVLRRVAARDIGRLSRIRVWIGHGRYHELPAWFRSPTLAGGGTLLDNGSHAVLLAHRLLALDGDRIATAKCTFEYRDPPPAVDCAARCDALSTSGRPIEIESTWVAQSGYRFEVEVSGDSGRLHIDGPASLRHATAEGALAPVVVPERGPSWRLDTQDFLQAVATRATPEYGGADALAVADVFEQGYRPAP